MKKLLIFCLLFLAMPVLQIHATPPQTYSGIAVVLTGIDDLIPADETENYDLGGYVDLLVRRDDMPSDWILTTVNANYREVYPFYQDIEHLGGSDWISYAAYIKDASFSYDNTYERGNIFEFAYSLGHYARISRVKVVFFSETGDTVFESNEVVIPKLRYNQTYEHDSHLELNMTDQILINHINVVFNGFSLLYYFMGFFLVSLLVGFKLVISSIMKAPIAHEVTFILASWLSLYLAFLLYRMSRSYSSPFLILRNEIVHGDILPLLAAGYLFIESVVFYLLFRKPVIRRYLIKSTPVIIASLVIFWGVLHFIL